MNTLSLAWRNLLRNRRRSLMTLIAMVLGLTAVLLFGGYIRDINYALQSDFVRLTGHLQIQHKDYFRFGSGNPAAYGIASYERIIAAVNQDPVLKPMLAVVTPTLQFGAIAGNFAAGVSRTVFVNGTVVEDQNRMREWNDYGLRRLSRSLSLSGTAPDTAVIGIGVARVLQLCAPLDVPDCVSAATRSETQGPALPPDIAALANRGQAPAAAAPHRGRPRIEILAANSRGAPNVAAVKVLRAEFQGIKELDDAYVGLHLSQAQKLIFGAARPQATAIALQLRHTAQLPAAQERLEELLRTTLKDEPLGIVDYETLNPFYGQTLAMFTAIFGFISVLIGAIVLFTVTNTMSMAVVERTAEIGTLRAIGLRRGGIRAMFVSEGVVLGCFGALLGSVAALGLAWAINQLGLTWTPPGRIEPVPLAVRLAGEHGMMIASAIALVVVAALSAILPAARAARMNIVDALRHV
ncbi:MAG: ABC transporter permease [Rhizobacter sp.]|nr:ABC transporter permease [Rhizobacter sp.]